MVELEGITVGSTWDAEGCRLTVAWSPAVLEAIRLRAVEGYNAFGHGGLEIGGVLFGVREGDLVRVLHFAELAGEHAEGPGFVLSANEQIAFAALMAAPPGLQPVGWFCSHTRNGLALNRNDEALFDRFFPDPGQIALILKPSRLGSAEATVYFRKPEGELCDGAPQRRFTIDPPKDPQPVEEAGQEACPTTPIMLPAIPPPVIPEPARAARRLRSVLL